MNIIQDLTLDLSQGEMEQTVYAKQGEQDSRFLRITLTNHGQPFSLPHHIQVLFRAMKPDGTLCCQQASIAPDHTIGVELTAQTLIVPGIVIADLQLIDAQDSVLACASFRIQVAAAPAGTREDSRNELPALVQLAEQAAASAARAAETEARLPELIRQQLQQAKDSGAFDGPMGPQPPLDPTLSRRGFAAEASAVGDRMNQQEQAFSKQLNSLIFSGAGAHNSFFRGKHLGFSVSDAQYAAIRTGSFQDLYIGDFWVIDDRTYRIASFDYFYGTGNPSMTNHHVVLIPDEPLYTAVMDASGTSNHGYVLSDMCKTHLNTARSLIRTAFPGHVVKVPLYLFDSAADGVPSHGLWYQDTVFLMSELSLFGSRIFSRQAPGLMNFIVDKSQFQLFALRPDLIQSSHNFWLRDPVLTNYYANASALGYANTQQAGSADGVRPFFCITG